MHIVLCFTFLLCVHVIQCYLEPERGKASQVLDVAYKALVIWPPAYL